MAVTSLEEMARDDFIGTRVSVDGETAQHRLSFVIIVISGKVNNAFAISGNTLHGVEGESAARDRVSAEVVFEKLTRGNISKDVRGRMGMFRVASKSA